LNWHGGFQLLFLDREAAEVLDPGETLVSVVHSKLLDIAAKRMRERGASGASGSLTAATKTKTTNNPSSHPFHRILFVPIQLPSTPTLDFDPITVDVKEGDAPLSIGRESARDSADIAFKSQVVSRNHSEIWAESGGKLFIRDTKSSTGTFINFFRLSPSCETSQPFQLRDGDILQFGVPYEGEVEDKYKCVSGTVWIEATPNVSKSVPLSQLSRPYADVSRTPQHELHCQTTFHGCP
jgi:hypothetical protein